MATTAPAPTTPAAAPTTMPRRLRRRGTRRIRLERALYLATAGGCAAAPHLAHTPYPGLAGLAAAAGGTAWLYRNVAAAIRDAAHGEETDDTEGVGRRMLAAGQRALPWITGGALDLAALQASPHAWWPALAAAAWGSAMAWMAPITRAAHLHTPHDDHGDGDTEAPPRSYPEALARMWRDAGLPGDTRLTRVRHLDPARPDFDAIIAAPAGQPVPDIDTRRLAAIFDVPVGAAAMTELPDAGPGRMLLTVRLPDAGEKPGGISALWRQAVERSTSLPPSTALVRHRIEPDRILLHVAVPEGQLLQLPQQQLCSALGIDDTTRIVVETDGVRQGLVHLYRHNPLLHIRKPTVRDLIMDKSGRVTLMIRHDGRPVTFQLYDPGQGALRGLIAGATGAGKSELLQLILAAERQNNIVSWVADVQGMSLPIASSRVSRYAAGEQATMHLLRDAQRVMRYRERQSTQMRRGRFHLNDPWPLLNITCDEINRLLSDEKWKPQAAPIIADIQKTGRKVGVGIRLAVQSLHLKDLGDEEAIRQQGKAGPVIMLRVLSSSTRDMGLDGIAPPGLQLANIPVKLHPGGGIAAAFDQRGDDALDEGISTAGMGYAFGEGRVDYMRVLHAGSDDDLAALFGDGPLPSLTDAENAVVANSGNTPDEDSDGLSEDDGRDNAFSASAFAEFGAPLSADDAPGRAAPLRDRVLEVLAEAGQPIPVRDIRRALPDAQAVSVSNALTALNAAGLAVPVSHGVWALPDPTT